MLFHSKINDQKNKSNQFITSKIERLKLMLNKVKFVAKNAIYSKKWTNENEYFQSDENSLKTNVISPRCFDINLSKFSIRIIDNSDQLMKKVKLLRQKSFFEQSNDSQIDSDEFDEFCDHLVVVDKSVSKDFVVGTYRLLLKPKLLKNQRFYSQSEFDISNLLNNGKSTLLEAGRSCVHKNYRDGRIIKLLWRGLATYIIKNQVDLIFGCASFPSCDYTLYRNQLSYLHHYHRPPDFLNTLPIKKLKANFQIIKKEQINSREEFRKLPPLIKAYIRVGAWVGSGAIVDSKFNTTDVLIVLNSKKILKRYAQLSFKKFN
jgi:putative hemolysin